MERSLDEDPATNLIFASGIQLHERHITPSTPKVIEISRLMYNEFLNDNPEVAKIILPEYLDYYCTAMVWFRIVSLKPKLCQGITPLEKDLLLLLKQKKFNIPDPLFMQLKVLGSISSVEEDIYPSFPDLPTNKVANHGGYYGPINVETHNLYEEIPCLGVLSEAVRQSVSDAAPGSYASALSAEDIIPNTNLLGYLPLGERQPEAKNIAYDCGISVANFPESPDDTGINMQLLFEISQFLTWRYTFKMSTIYFKSLSKNGSVIQTTIQLPLKSIIPVMLEKNDELIVFSSINKETVFGAAIMFTPQLFKTDDTATLASSWACIDNPPLAFITNRNERRIVPKFYSEQINVSKPKNERQYRVITIQKMRIRKDY